MYNNKKNIIIIAGEESGDQHGAELVNQLKKRHENINFTGIGGRHLKDAGMNLLINLAQYSVTGFSEVIQNIWIIKKAFNLLKNHLEQNPVDLIILVDFPGFNLRFAKYVKKHYKIPVLYYISPQIWAWKAGRIKTIKANVDHMAVILPFEKSIYEKAGVPVNYVGHPLEHHLNFHADKIKLRQILNLPSDKKIIALLPGSRKNEIERLMPVLVETMQLLLKKHPDLHFAIPVAGSINSSAITQYLPSTPLPLHLFNQKAREVIAASDCVVVASGTASLECALLTIPGCIIYKASALTAWVARKVIKISWLGLANIIAQKTLMPELLQNECNAVAISQKISSMLSSPDDYDEFQKNLHEFRSMLSMEAADMRIDELVEQYL